jgi:hypothetical protein
MAKSSFGEAPNKKRPMQFQNLFFCRQAANKILTFGLYCETGYFIGNQTSREVKGNEAYPHPFYMRSQQCKKPDGPGSAARDGSRAL